MEDMRKNNLEEEIMKLMEKDSRQKDPKVSKVTEKKIINMFADFDLTDVYRNVFDQLSLSNWLIS